MSYTAADVKTLREMTGAGMLDCKKALDESKGNMDSAVDWLRKKGIANAAKKAGREATEGLVASYVHSGSKIAVLVEMNCETDFVALNTEFQAAGRDIAMHIAAMKPLWVRREEVPADAIGRERAVQLEKTMAEGKPAHIAEKIVEGRMNKWFSEVCLLEQTFFKDDEKTVNDLVVGLVARIGENIKVRRFVRFEVGEGLEKKTQDFAAEVAAAMGA